MPYAIESEHAKSASSVTGAQAETLTQLSASVTALQAAAPTTGNPAPTPPAAPSFKYRFISVGNGCVYNGGTFSTVCTCAPGEIIVSAGGWAGPNAAINASRPQHGPDDTGASDSDRAREWTMSCLTLANVAVPCDRVQALCLKL